MATLPTEGWTRAADGRLPGAHTPRTCWLRLDVAQLATQVLMLQGAVGQKSVTLFDAAGRSIAVAHDFGEHRQVIAGR